MPSWSRRAALEYSSVRVYVATGVHPLESEHEVHIPEEAIADRRVIYGLGTDAEAVEAIIYEHLIRLRGSDQREPGAPMDARAPAHRAEPVGALRAQVPASVRAALDAVWEPDWKALRGEAMTDAEQRAIAERMRERRHPPRAAYASPARAPGAPIRGEPQP